MKECPRCGQRLGYAAKACKCGWKERSAAATTTEPTKPHIPCAHMECTNNAIIKEKTPTGWANLCYQHMMQAANERANEYCRALGIHTPQQCKDWLRKNKLLVKRQPVYERQPGEDDE